MSSKTKFIAFALGVLIVLGAVLGVIIALSTTTLDYNINQVKEGSEVETSVNEPTSIRIYYSTNSNYEDFAKGTDEYNKIMELYNESFKISKLNAYFSGATEYENKIETTSKTYSGITTTDTVIYIEFRYDTLQTVYLNGEIYYNNSTVLTQNKKEYLSLLVEVNDTEDLSETSIFIGNLSTDNSGDKNRGTSFSYKYATYTRQADLFAYLKTLKDNH